jgi:hypothetical protein
LPLDTQVEMRVTLSYFVEPSPGERGWDRKYGYPSHGLPFKVIRATENVNEFKLRINAHGREDHYDEDHVGETGTWDLGVTGPTNGLNRLCHISGFYLLLLSSRRGPGYAIPMP